MTVRTKPGYFLRHHESRKLLRFIHGAFAAGRRIQITTMTRSTVYDARHAGLFAASGGRVWLRQGAREVVLAHGWYEWQGKAHCASSVHIRAV
jgi:hypothetical protein